MMGDSSYFPPDYVRLPQLSFGVELELDFTLPRKAYADWLATDPEIPSGDDGEPTSTQKERDKAMIRYLQARIEESRESAVNAPGLANYRAENAIRDMTALVAYLKLGLLEKGPFLLFLQTKTSLKDHRTPNPVATPFRAGARHLHLQIQKVPNCPTEPALYGKISFDAPKTGPPTNWHLTWDSSLDPRRDEFADLIGEDGTSVKKSFRCVGAELVSAKLNWHEDEKWQPMFKQVEQDLTWDAAKGYGVWFTNYEHMHVHFGMLDAEWELDVAKTVMILYGLFEREIEQWVRVDLRRSIYCRSLRLGMERDRIGRAEDGSPTLIMGARYTPREFAERIWAAPGWEELKTETSGYSAGEGYGLADEKDTEYATNELVMARGWTAVGISVARGNKPLTLEFRQHQGTIEASVINMWIKFLGRLIRYAHFVFREMGIELRDRELHPTNPGFLELFVQNNSILDLLSFDNTEKTHFQLLARKFHDVDFSAKRELERQVIQERIRMTKLPTDNKTGQQMDAIIEKSPWYQAIIAKNSEIDVIPEPRVRAELWPTTSDAIAQFIVDEVRLQLPNLREFTAKEWFGDHVVELITKDRTGRAWLYFRIRNEQMLTRVFDEGRARQQDVAADVEMETPSGGLKISGP